MSDERPQSLIDTFVGAAHGDFDTVKSLLGQHPWLVQANASWQELPIEAAAQVGRVDLAEFLLENGAEMDICTAVMLGRHQTVDDFLRKDPNAIRAHGAHGIPLLYFAVISGNREMAEKLLRRGAEVNAGASGVTPLHGAVMFGQAEIAAWLLANGADPSLEDYNGSTPLQLAQANENHEISRILGGL